MELRSYNVLSVYSLCVRCRIKEDLGVDNYYLSLHEEDIRSMLDQIDWWDGGTIVLFLASRRSDGEMWTPHLQAVECLIRLGKKIGYLTYEGELNAETLIEKL